MPPELRPQSIINMEILSTQFPKGKEQEDAAKGVVDFRFDSAKLKAIKENLGITAFNAGETLIILERIYDGLKTRNNPDNERKINLSYEENKGLIREPATVLEKGKTDCDEATRTAYLLAWESGVRNIVMVEMHWFDPKTNEQTGHSFIILMPQEKDGIPRIYDLTYFKKGKPLTIENNDLEAAIRKEYAADAVNPNFRIITRGNLNEVEAAHYDQVGEYYGGKNPKMMTKAYERAVALEPSKLKYNRNLAFAYEKLKKWNDAISYYEKCAKSEEGKNNPWILGALGSAYAEVGRYEEAKNLLKKALDLNPDQWFKTEIIHNLNVIESK
ncbi:TPA: tetratricopeptide repeat protein [Candidatus Micrarchaeota archaeon]|nr:tetratricopeptide repeat protein [Candidatus Micrarchaeota archaeon]